MRGHPLIYAKNHTIDMRTPILIGLRYKYVSNFLGTEEKKVGKVIGKYSGPPMGKLVEVGFFQRFLHGYTHVKIERAGTGNATSRQIDYIPKKDVKKWAGKK